MSQQIHPMSDSATLLRTAAASIRLADEVDSDPFWGAVADLLDSSADRWGLLFICHDAATADFHCRLPLAVARAWTKDNT